MFAGQNESDTILDTETAADAVLNWSEEAAIEMRGNRGGRERGKKWEDVDERQRRGWAMIELNQPLTTPRNWRWVVGSILALPLPWLLSVTLPYPLSSPMFHFPLINFSFLAL